MKKRWLAALALSAALIGTNVAGGESASAMTRIGVSGQWSYPTYEASYQPFTKVTSGYTFNTPVFFVHRNRAIAAWRQQDVRVWQILEAWRKDASGRFAWRTSTWMRQAYTIDDDLVAIPSYGLRWTGGSGYRGDIPGYYRIRTVIQWGWASSLYSGDYTSGSYQFVTSNGEIRCARGSSCQWWTDRPYAYVNG